MMKIILRRELKHTRNFLNNTYRTTNVSHLGKALGLGIGLLFATFGQAQTTLSKRTTPAQEKTNTQSPFDAMKGKKEDISKRDLYSKHYPNGDGSYTALISAGPIHYKKNETYLDIDLSIQPSENATYPYANKANLFESYYGATAHQGVKNSASGVEIKEFLNTKMYWEVNGQANNITISNNPVVSIEGDKAYYHNLYGTIDAEFITERGRRKLNYIIPNRQALGNVPENADYLVFTEDMILPQGWYYKTDEKKGVTIYDHTGKAIYSYVNPISKDASNVLSKTVNTVYETILTGTTLTIKTKVKTSWLANDQRQFPIKVDPTVDFTATYLLSIYDDGGIENTGYFFGRVSNYWLRTFATYNLSSIPNGSTATSIISNVNITGNNGYNAANAVRMRNGIDPSVNSGTTLYNSAITNFANNFAISSLGWKALTLNAAGITYVQSAFGGNVHLAIDPAGSYLATNYYQISSVPYLRINYTAAASMTCATLTNLTASLGTPVNGLNHFLRLDWNAITGATGYDVQFSVDGTNYSNATPSSVTTIYADMNAGDYPNSRYWFRVRAKDATQTCDWTYASPIYTAADVPSVPVLTNAVGTSLDLTLQAETPVVNPAITTYSIVCSTNGLFVQADGSLGATEVFRTKADWGTVHVIGLTAGIEYCFYAKARNGDGHVVSGGTNISGLETFVSNTNFNATSAAPTNRWWTPPTPTSGSPMVYTATGSSCGDGYVGFSGSFNNFFGSFLRSPQQNCTGMNEVTMTFDLSNSYFAAQPLDRIYFNMWAPTAASPGGTYINATAVDGVATNSLNFSEVRSCKRVTVTFNLSTVTNKAAILFYLNVSCGYNNSNVFFFRLDNISILDKAPTTCITPANAPTPFFHNTGGSQQIAFDNARHSSDRPIFRVSHTGTSAATNYQIEMNTKEDFTGTSILQTFTGVYPGQTQANFTFSNAEAQLVNLTTYYVRARINIGTGYGNWSAKLHSYTYDTGKAQPNWFQTSTPQFATDALIGTQTITNFTTPATPSVSGGGNVIQNGTFASTSNWTTAKTSGTGGIIDLSNTDCYNCPSGTTRNLKFYIFGGQALSGDIYVVSQTVDLTGVDVLSFNLNAYYNGHSVGQGSVSNLRVIIGGTTTNDAGTVLYTMAQPSCGTYCTATNNQSLNLDVSSYTGTQTIKFVWKFTGTFYDTGLTAFYINNVTTSSAPVTPSGTIISTPIRLASVQGATGYKELVWNQELSGGSVRFDMQRYNTTNSLWENISGFSGIQDPTSNGEKSFDLQGSSFPAHDSIRVVGYLVGSVGGLKLNDWAIYFTYPSTPLPVTLTSFTATCEREVKLSWSTASEQNSDVFIVEKSKDLVDWIFVANKPAAGNSSIKINYTELDQNPWRDVAYYRLRQVDLNGQEAIYGPISVSCDHTENSVTVYPNPNQGNFTIEVLSTSNMRGVQLYLTDLTGKTITSRTVDIPAGTTQIFLDDLDLQMGTYLIQFQGTGDQLKPAKVVVNR